MQLIFPNSNIQFEMLPNRVVEISIYDNNFGICGVGARKILRSAMALPKRGVIALFDVDGTLTAPRKV